MKQFALMLVVLFLCSAAVLAQKPKTEPAKPKKSKAFVLKTTEEKMSYLSGFDLGQKVRANVLETSFPISNSAFLEGIRQALEGKNNQMSEEEIREVTEIFQQMNQKAQAENEIKQKFEADQNKRRGAEFLEANGKKDSVKTTASGLQYKILREGTGISPKESSTVVVHYRGWVINGTVFDESYKNNEPATFPLNQMIKGWIEGLQLMKEGSKFEFYIPAALAWGDRAAGELIPPGSTVIFQVELIKVN